MGREKLEENTNGFVFVITRKNLFTKEDSSQSCIYFPYAGIIILQIQVWTICSRRYSGLACNLIRRIISPNQDDLSYSNRISFPGQQKLGKLPNTFSLAGQRRPVQTSHWRLFNSSSSMYTTLLPPVLDHSADYTNYGNSLPQPCLPPSNLSATAWG